MHPYWAMRMHRGPSRIVWFVLGSVTTAWWMRRREIDEHHNHHRWGQGFCRRPPIQAPPSIQPMDPEAPPFNMTPTPQTSQNPQHPLPSWTPQQWKTSQEAEARWEEDKARMVAIGRQAGDTMTDLSEQTLDTVLSTVEALKAKLAEHRAERERTQKALDEKLEREAREPHRWV